METLLTRASDSSDNTWIDRFLAKDLKALTQEVKNENPSLTPTDINKELDKKYNDDAKKIRDKWNAFNEILINYDTANERADDVIDSVEEKEEKQGEIKIDKNSSEQEVLEASMEAFDTQVAMVKAGRAAEDIAAYDFLETVKYGNGTLLDFFLKDVAEFPARKTFAICIRSWKRFPAVSWQAWTSYPSRTWL